MNQKEIKQIKNKYPKGTRIQLNHMNDPLHPIDDGTLGTVDHVDDAGQIHMHWDDGRGLAIVPEVDDFTIIDFIQEEEEKIRVVIVEPNEVPRVELIKNDLETMQEIVGGRIEEVALNDDAILVCNEEGKFTGMKANRRVGNDIIAGTFFIAGDQGLEYLVSLTEEQVEQYTERFQKIEDLSQEEMFDGFAYRIFGGHL